MRVVYPGKVVAKCRLCQHMGIDSYQPWNGLPSGVGGTKSQDNFQTALNAF